MIDLKEWQRWFETKGYDSKLFESDTVLGELVIEVKEWLAVSVLENGKVYINGSVQTESKTDLWKLINTLGVIK